MSEPKQLTELRRKVNAKTREIEALVASTYGLGDIKNFDRAALRGLEIEVEKMIEEYEGSLHDGGHRRGMARTRRKACWHGDRSITASAPQHCRRDPRLAGRLQ
jgi:hypothetical protein